VEAEMSGDRVAETLVAVAIFLGGLLLARLLQTSLRWIVHMVVRSPERWRDERLSRALRLPLALLIIATAGFAALRTLSYLDPHRATMERAWGAVILAVAVLLAQRLISALLLRINENGFGPEAAGAYATPLVRRALNFAIFAVGVLLVLDQLGISISPLLAGLGISGLAVALALQPLLTNLFAGSYVMSDSSIEDGDFVTILNGPSGHVVDIGWRATRLRSLEGQMVIVPNATLANSIVTNYGAGRPADVSVVYSLPFEQDLERVEVAAREVLRSVIQECDEAVKDFKPVVRFQSMTDSRVECLLQLRARSRIDVPELTHVVLKRLHHRFQSDGLDGQ